MTTQRPGWTPLGALIDSLPLPPYLVETSRLRALRGELRDAGFQLAEVDCAMATGERNLLELLGATLNFPGYYRPNWDAFDDCVGDMMREDAFPTAVLLSNADEFLRARPQDFVRAIHLLYTASEAVELNHGIFRLEFVLFGSWTL